MKFMLKKRPIAKIISKLMLSIFVLYSYLNENRDFKIFIKDLWLIASSIMKSPHVPYMFSKFIVPRRKENRAMAKSPSPSETNMLSEDRGGFFLFCSFFNAENPKEIAVNVINPMISIIAAIFVINPYSVLNVFGRMNNGFNSSGIQSEKASCMSFNVELFPAISCVFAVNSDGSESCLRSAIPVEASYSYTKSSPV